MIEDTAREAQHNICPAAYFAAVPMRPAYAESYAGPPLVSGLSWAAHRPVLWCSDASGGLGILCGLQ